MIKFFNWISEVLHIPGELLPTKVYTPDSTYRIGAKILLAPLFIVWIIYVIFLFNAHRLYTWAVHKKEID